jgi:PST family polysaccharide transporter
VTTQAAVPPGPPAPDLAEDLVAPPPADPPRNDAADAGDPGWGRQVRRALAFGFAGQLAVRLGTFASGVLFAHLLAPRDFGVFAVALVVASVITNVNDLGLIWTIVRSPGDVSRMLPTATTVTLASSGVLYLGTAASASPLASALHAPQAAAVLRLLAVSVLIDALSAVPAALLTRRLQQGRRAFADVTGLVVSTSTTAALALNGYGAWSLAWGRVLGNTAATLLVFVLARALPRPGWNRAVARELLHFGLPTAGSALIGYALLNVSYVVVGHRLGPVSLGVYVLAFNLASWPVTMVTMAVRKVSIAAFGQLAGDPERLRRAVVSSMSLAITATLPFCLVLGILARPLVHSVYGDKWAASAEILVPLAVLGGARVIVALADDVLQASGHPRSVLVVQACWFAALIPGLWLAASWDGSRGVAEGHAAISVAVVVLMLAMLRRTLSVSLSDLARSTARPVAAAVVAGGVGFVVSRALPDGAVRLLVGTVVLLATYAAIVGPSAVARVRVSRRSA